MPDSDTIVIFNPLDTEMMNKIVEIQLELLKERLKKQQLEIEVTDKLKAHLKGIGFDPVYGARPLKRIINEILIDEIAFQVIEGKIKPGESIKADFKEGKVMLSVQKPN
jgi:ATP-dependent Clp protease ATP-binding subunit ClpB